jgi:hypothetical protein
MTTTGALDRTRLERLRNEIGEQDLAGSLELFKSDISNGVWPFDGDPASMTREAADAIARAAEMLGFDELRGACRVLEVVVAQGSPIEAALERYRRARIQVQQVLVLLAAEGWFDVVDPKAGGHSSPMA